DVDVLAGLAGPDRRQRVPVVGGGDGQGGDVLVLQYAAHVALDPGLFLLALAQQFQGGRHHVVVGLDQVGDLGVGEGAEAADVVLAAAAQAHDGDDDALVGPVGGAGGGAGRQGGRGEGGGLEEITAVRRRHGGPPFAAQENEMAAPRPGTPSRD